MAMGRNPKPDGRNGIKPVKDDREFIARASARCDIRECNGSHFKAVDRDGNVMTAYHTHGDQYPRGIGIALAKWLAVAGLVLAAAGLVLAVAWLFF
jgi:hypothetical protein